MQVDEKKLQTLEIISAVVIGVTTIFGALIFPLSGAATR